MLFTNSDAGRVLAALDRSLAIIAFTPTGVILEANDNFCHLMGYAAGEIRGRSHQMFVEPEYAQSEDYRAFWRELASGKFVERDFRRIARGGREVWIQASYNPVKDRLGRVVKVVKVAADITEDKLRNARFEGKVNAISRSQAVIEFDPTGVILEANDNFLSAMGYTKEEIVGRHHRIFVDPAYAASDGYRRFWERLNAGEFESAEFRRIGKGGREVWIQATYNPIFDLSGRVERIVKFATDVTARVRSVDTLGRAMRELDSSNLAHRISEPVAADFEGLKRALNDSLARLETSMSRVVSGAGAIGNGVARVAAASKELSARTSRQASSLRQTVDALEAITETVARSVEGTTVAATSAGEARASAEKSGTVMHEAMTAMSEIEDSSSRITHIIEVIDEIAFQTNLLALNAGVEAARAGEAGRGFAVVAAEVRALAQRSADAAHQIKDLIGTSSRKVEHGVRLVTGTGEALTSIVERVSGIDQLLGDIAASAKEQSAGLSRVNAAMEQMDQVTRDNARMVEETDRDTSSLEGEVNDLLHMVSAFRISAAAAAEEPADVRAA